MKRRLQCLGLAVLGAVALSSVGASSASAEVSGHFISDLHHTELRGLESGTDRTEFKLGGIWDFQCEETSYTGTVVETTVQQVTVTPTYSKCVRTVEEGEDEKITVKTNGCQFIAKTGRGEVHNTAELVCPAGKKIELTSSVCGLKINPQLVSGLEYTTITEFGKDAITVDVTAKVSAIEVHSGICIFLGTSTVVGELTGSAKVRGVSTFEEPINITATDGPAPTKFRSEVAHPTLTGAQVAESAYTFGILMGSVKCATTSVSGTIATAVTEEITLSPTYGSCKGLERNVTVDMNGCAYVLKVKSTTSAGVTIECPAEKSIETTYDSFEGGCTITIGAQNASGNVDVKNEGAGTTRDILLTWTLSGLKYKRDGCEVGGEATNGTYSGSVTLKGQDTEGTQKGIWYG